MTDPTGLPNNLIRFHMNAWCTDAASDSRRKGWYVQRTTSLPNPPSLQHVLLTLAFEMLAGLWQIAFGPPVPSSCFLLLARPRSPYLPKAV